MRGAIGDGYEGENVRGCVGAGIAEELAGLKAAAQRKELLMTRDQVWGLWWAVCRSKGCACDMYGQAEG